MSSGTLAKAKLAFTLSRNVKLYLLDEPFANIDLVAREEIYSLILREFNPETTIILSTHFINEIEMLLDRVMLMKEGIITADINVEEYKEKNDKSIVEFYRETMKTEVSWKIILKGAVRNEKRIIRYKIIKSNERREKWTD